MSINTQMRIDLEKIRALPDSELEQTIKELKGNVLTLVHDAGSGHCGGSLSLMRALMLYYREIHDEERRGPHLSKGHCVPALYALGHRFGDITLEEMARFRTPEGLSGHAEGRVQAVPSGLLGLGGGIVNGMARESRKKVYGFFGDGELDEPAMWGALERATNGGFNVCYVIDFNGKNLSGPLKRNFDTKAGAIEMLGIKVIDPDNNVEQLSRAFQEAEEYRGPVALIVHSIKGEGISFMKAHPNGWHGDPLPDDKYEQAMGELGLSRRSFREICGPPITVRDLCVEGAMARLKEKGFGLTEEATRTANNYWAELGRRDDRIRVLIPDIGKSVNMDKFAQEFPERFTDVGIDEMSAVLEATGMSACGLKPVVSTFDGFTHIPFSAIRMADYGKVPFLGVVMTHCEFLGEDGPSHLMTENLGAWLGLYNLRTLVNPADILQARQGLEFAAERGGLFYARLGRPKVPTLYTPINLPPPGRADVLRSGSATAPVIITTGQEVWESLIAAELLENDGVKPAVINVAYFHPFDGGTIAREASGRLVVTAEAHNPQVGLASLVAYHLAKEGVHHLGFVPLGTTGYVPSGTIEQQKQLFGLLGKQIYERITQEIR